MSKYLILFLLISPLSTILGQNNGITIIADVPTFQLYQHLDSLSCMEYDSLKNRIDQYNRQQRIKAWRIVDSMSHFEHHCYEFDLFLEWDQSISDYVKRPNGCSTWSNSDEILALNSHWKIRKRRRSKLRSRLMYIAGRTS